MISSVTVYCSSSRHVAPVYFEAAEHLGAAIAQRQWRLVYGGNSLGLMAALADAARAAGGKVTGITPQLLVDAGGADVLCDELIVTETMRERKAVLEHRGDAFIALPGGIGTLEEIFEIIVGKLLGVHAKPIVLLDIAEFYRPLLAMIDHAIAQRFAKPSARRLFEVATTVPQALEYIAASRPDIPPGPAAAAE